MRVVVIGAGLAGLRSAQLLKDAGHEVLVYEARDRVGGRLLTEQAGDGYYDAGGEWVDADHSRVLSLMEVYGLEPLKSEMWPGKVVLNGVESTEDAPGVEAEADAAAVHEEAVRLCGELGEPVWESSLSGSEESLGDWLEGQCVSDQGRRFVEAVQRSDEGDDTDQVGLLGWLWSYKNYLERGEGDMSLYRIPGGAGGLCERMAEEMAEQVYLEKPLRSVDFHEAGVQCWLDGEVVFADHVVVATPVSCLPKIEWPIEMPLEYQQAWEAMRMARAVKVSLVFQSAWWESVGWSGRLLTDLPCQQAWLAGQEGAFVVNCYVCGEAADELRGSSDPVGRALRALGEVFRSCLDVFESGTLHDWIGDEWAGGAFPSLPVGALGVVQDWLRTPYETIHFAGDHTAQWFGFMEGALESAERVVREIG